jgi:hypothetical protein
MSNIQYMHIMYSSKIHATLFYLCGAIITFFYNSGTFLGQNNLVKLANKVMGTVIYFNLLTVFSSRFDFCIWRTVRTLN